MPTIILRVAKDRDDYVGWSTVVEAPVMFGDREDMLRMMREDLAQSHPGMSPAPDHRPEARLKRADENGSSSMGGFSFFGAWDDEGLILQQRGVLPRDRLGEAVDWWIANGPDADLPSSFMEPFEDLGVVRDPA